MADLLDLVATQVRLDYPRAQVHKLDRAEQHSDGRVYWATCGVVLSNVAGALLTTQEVTCNDCWRGSRTPRGPRPGSGKGNASQASGSPDQGAVRDEVTTQAHTDSAEGGDRRG